jgi:hypothetical protein
MSSLKKRFPGEPCLAVARSVWGREAVGWKGRLGGRGGLRPRPRRRRREPHGCRMISNRIFWIGPGNVGERIRRLFGLESSLVDDTSPRKEKVCGDQ